MRALFVIMSSVLFLLNGLSARGSASDGPRMLRVGSNVNVDHPSNQSLLYMGEIVKEKTQGRISFKLFPNSTLGTESEMFEQLQNGLLDLMKGGGYSGVFHPAFQVISLPYIFDSQEHFYRVLEDPQVRNIIFSGSYDKGFITLDYLDKGARSFYSISTPIITPDDLKGLKIRVMNDKVSVRMLDLLGGHPVPLSYSEIYTALQQGVIDGAESDETVLTIGRHGEVAKVWSADGHFRLPDYITISSQTWNSLSEEDQQIFVEAAAAAREHQKQTWSQAIDQAIEQAKAQLQVEFYQSDVSAFQKLVEPMVTEFEEEHPDLKPLIDRIDQLR